MKSCLANSVCSGKQYMIPEKKINLYQFKSRRLGGRPGKYIIRLSLSYEQFEALNTGTGESISGRLRLD